MKPVKLLTCHGVMIILAVPTFLISASLVAVLVAILQITFSIAVFPVLRWEEEGSCA